MVSPPAILCAMAVLLTTGCATIAHQTTQEIAVRSTPDGAAVTVDCGVSNYSNAVTPTTVTVRRKPDYCMIKLRKDGYEDAEFHLRKRVSGWFFGNVLIGGLVGIVIDASNGAMFDRTPGEISAVLKQRAEKSVGGGSGPPSESPGSTRVPQEMFEYSPPLTTGESAASLSKKLRPGLQKSDVSAKYGEPSAKHRASDAVEFWNYRYSDGAVTIRFVDGIAAEIMLDREQ